MLDWGEPDTQQCVFIMKEQKQKQRTTTKLACWYMLAIQAAWRLSKEDKDLRPALAL